MWIYVSVIVFLFSIFVLWYKKTNYISHRYEDLYILITGCDSGFGYMAAENFDSLGFNVFACCLTDDGLQNLRSTTSNRLVPLLLDIKDEESVLEAYDTVKANLPENKGLWGLINNAGIAGRCGIFDGLTSDAYLECFLVNAMGMIRMNKHFIPLLRKAKGRIINMSSMAGKIGVCYAGPYCASKFAVEGYSDVLRRELWHQGVKVIVVEPGYFATSMSSNLKVAESMQSAFDTLSEDSRLYYGTQFLETVLKRILGDNSKSKDTHKVINVFLEAMTSYRPKTRYMVGTDANTIFWFISLIPDWLGDRIMTRTLPKPANL